MNSLSNSQLQNRVLISLLEVFAFDIMSPACMVWGETNESKEGEYSWLPSHGQDYREEEHPGEKKHLNVSCFHIRFFWHPLCLPTGTFNPRVGLRWCPNILVSVLSKTWGCSNLLTNMGLLSPKAAQVCMVLSPITNTVLSTTGAIWGAQGWAAPTPATPPTSEGPSVLLPRVLLRVLDSIINLRGTYGDISVSTWSLRSFSPPIWFIGRELG